MSKKNVLVIGAGLAGTSTAFFLKLLDRNGDVNVDLIEMQRSSSYSKYHRMCGEAISAKTFEELAPLKPTNVIEKIKFIEEFYPGDISFKSDVEGYIINRPLFLQAIIKEFEDLGGNFENKKAVNLVNGRNKVLVKFLNNELRRYDYVIAADGANSVIQNSFGLHVGAIRKFIQYVVDEEPEHSTLKFFYNKSYQGDYKWIFPNGSTTKIGYPIISGKVPNLEINAKVIEKQARCIRFGLMKKYVFGRTLVVGDAACQINPLTKGGIRPAMNSGKMAAEAILLGNLRLYENKCKKSVFSSEIFYVAFNRLKEMSDNELFELAVSYKSGEFPRKYKNLLMAFKLSEEFGW
ncbi:MAG: NAD(P)/FAD-dependent oxidoreductase [Candidatus Altiarchaeota archaeon]|nr:NAD(P)/FAD-dependent oxidoreductase [Candidatus Altiarchaeota archaeon]